MRNKNLLEFCLSPDLGGLELFVANCFNDFRTKGSCKIAVAPDKKLDNYLEGKDKFYIKRNKFFPIIPALKLARFIDKSDIDVVHFHWTKDIGTVVLAKVLSKKKPKIIQTRNMTMTRFKDDFYHKWLYKNIDTIHAVTYQVKEQLERFIPKDVCPKVEVVYMGTKELDIKQQKVQSLKDKYNLTDEFIVGIVGRIEEGKGQWIVIEAISMLKELNIKVVIVGHTMDENYLESLKQKVKDLGVEDKIIFTGFTKEVDAHMKLFDVNILATPKETFGLVVIEAMVNKVCMIATNSGGPLEIIEDGVDGLLFDRSSEDLAEKIKLLYANKTLKESLALSGYEKAKEKFEASKQNEKLLNILKGM
ncbi:glycosyltransferase family 4 protein [Candidatus Sulfurimonas marisnigri]|uniref:Glycosyltransferase family 4 protein n=1 Tax=Candidatus Sulfurimonas marisnigri TaxID=2740405 RepID=A0A7S7RR35_9BACT|nr:glycosyltransferase family 4 protein [Candidatus Sulfurimonas marisnigri]QOY55228.1 glycosyltransferase family 4 protein [Candidatus Sulfurimonas marisnigri]